MSHTIQDSDIQRVEGIVAKATASIDRASGLFEQSPFQTQWTNPLPGGASLLKDAVIALKDIRLQQVNALESIRREEASLKAQKEEATKDAERVSGKERELKDLERNLNTQRDQQSRERDQLRDREIDLKDDREKLRKREEALDTKASQIREDREKAEDAASEQLQQT